VRHFAIWSQEACVEWVRRFLLFHHKRHTRHLGKAEINEFPTHLAVDHRVSASTQNQALSALLFFCRHVLEQEFPWLGELVHAQSGPGGCPS
jgi:hypothetical protein